MTVLTNARERGRFFRFLIVGAIGFVVDFGVMNLLTQVIPYPLPLGAFVVPLLTWAGTVSFICAVINNYLWNRYWTYPDSRSKSVVRQFVTFTVVSALGLLIRWPILYFGEPAVRWLLEHIPYPLAHSLLDFLTHNLTLAAAVLIVLFWNFFVNRYITYNDVK